jgi:hypothetical protein
MGALLSTGPGAAQQLVDTTKGYAVLLNKGKEPLTAGLMDVYGKVRVPFDWHGHCMRILDTARTCWSDPVLLLLPVHSTATDTSHVSLLPGRLFLGSSGRSAMVTALCAFCLIQAKPVHMHPALFSPGSLSHRL